MTSTSVDQEWEINMLCPFTLAINISSDLNFLSASTVAQDCSNIHAASPVLLLFVFLFCTTIL